MDTDPKTTDTDSDAQHRGSSYPRPCRLAVTDGGTDQTPPTDAASPAAFDVYVDEAGEWRWRLVHANGKILADSGEGYATRQKAREGLSSVKINAPDAPVEVDPDASAKARGHREKEREEAEERFDRIADPNTDPANTGERMREGIPDADKRESTPDDESDDPATESAPADEEANLDG